jgi:hypothetical protein
MEAAMSAETSIYICLLILYKYPTSLVSSMHKDWLRQYVNLQVTVCTNSLTSNNCTFSHTACMCFVFVWEQTAICATYSINWLDIITKMKSVYSAVRTGALNEAACACVTYSINWLVFINEMKSVYSAVRTGSLNEAVCACATYSINW